MSQGILTCDETRAAETAADAAGVSLWALMERAGGACAEAVNARWPEGRVVVLCGPGNNGGDGFVAARRLRELGREVIVAELAGGARSAEGARARAQWTGDVAGAGAVGFRADDVIVDALFGAGLNRALEGEAADIVRRVNASGLPVLAVDVPSGVSGDTGRVAGEAIKAALTVTFGAKKPAHVLQPASELCGEVAVFNIGFEPFLPTPKLWENSPELWAGKLNWPGSDSHKYARGKLMVVTGPLASTGAARLAAYAGLRAGAGAVTLLCPPGALVVVAGAVMAPMTASFRDAAELAEKAQGARAVIIGPAAGVNDATRANVEALSGQRLVLDADGLSVFAGNVAALKKVVSADCVLTPHVGEFERLWPGLRDRATDKVAATRRAAEEVGAVVLLKGPDTVIAAPDGRAVVNLHATPFLATAGSGDTLAGIIGGLMATGMDAFDAACAGVWMHGDAGLRAGPGLTAEDLYVALKETIGALYEGRLVRGTVS